MVGVRGRKRLGSCSQPHHQPRKAEEGYCCRQAEGHEGTQLRIVFSQENEGAAASQAPKAAAAAAAAMSAHMDMLPQQRPACQMLSLPPAEGSERESCTEKRSCLRVSMSRSTICQYNTHHHQQATHAQRRLLKLLEGEKDKQRESHREVLRK